jgi:hypothetical protein
VLTFLCLHSVQDKVSYMEGLDVHPLGMVSFKRLLVLVRPCNDDVRRFLEQVDSILGDLYCSSMGNIASESYSIKKCVQLVDLLGVVCKLLTTEGTSVAHFSSLVLSQAWTSSPSWVRMQGFKPCSIRPLACSTCPFVHGWATAALST